MTRIANNSKVLRYEIVLMKGDQVIDEGRLGEVAKRRGVHPETIKFYLTKAYERRLAKAKSLDNRLTAFRTDIDDIEDEF